MALIPIIAGFPSSNRIPGAFGEVLYGTAGQSAASLPLLLLVVGLKVAAGSITPNTQVQIIGSQADADNYAGIGSEGACMLYDVLKVAGNAGVPVYYASPTPPSGATTSSGYLTIGGTWNVQGQINVRVDGVTVPVTVNATDTANEVATNVASAIAGYNGGRLSCTASATGAVTTIACNTPGTRGMQHVVFVDTTQVPSGLTATWYTTWSAMETVAVGATAVPTAAHLNGYWYKATAITTGITNASEPTWPTTLGTTVVDSGVTWTCWGVTATSSSNVVGIFLGYATGLETYTALLGTLVNSQFNRIALAANDSTSLSAWSTQVTEQAAAPYDLLQHVVTASNSTLTAAIALAQTTLNNPRFQHAWALNCETHPSRIASAIGAQRAMSEQQDPDSAYNIFPMLTIAPQSMPADWNTIATEISALNNSVTPLRTQRGDNFMRIVRSITTFSLANSAPDYATFDTGQASVPDFVLTDWRLYYVSKLQPSNPRVQDNPNIAAGEKEPPYGVLYPLRVQNIFTSKLSDYSLGILAGSTSTPNSTGGTCPPIVDPPQVGDVQAVFDPVAKRIMVTANVRVKANDAQLGISIRQAA